MQPKKKNLENQKNVHLEQKKKKSFLFKLHGSL